MAKTEIEQQDTEAILLAALVALIQERVQAGADILDILDDIPGMIHADVIEGLARLGMI